MRPNDCPVCHAPDGFHDEDPHSAAREAIPARLRRPSNSALRREERARHAAQVQLYGTPPRTFEDDLVEQEVRLHVAQQHRLFYEGEQGRALLADMAAALLTPDVIIVPRDRES